MNGREILEQAWERIHGLAQDVREAYQEANRFARMRLWVAAFVVLDALVTVGFVAASGGGPDLEIWYEVGFPSNMIIVRNHDGYPVKNLQILLDNQYELTVEEIAAESVAGFEIDREFRDPEGRTPDAQYVPRTARLTRGGSSEVRELRSASGP